MGVRLPRPHTAAMPSPDPRHVTAVSLATMVAAIAPVHLFGALAPDIQEEFGFGDARQGYAVDWLADLEQRHAITAIRANIDREGDGRARAQIVLERSGG